MSSRGILFIYIGREFFRNEREHTDHIKFICNDIMYTVRFRFFSVVIKLYFMASHSTRKVWYALDQLMNKINEMNTKELINNFYFFNVTHGTADYTYIKTFYLLLFDCLISILSI